MCRVVVIEDGERSYQVLAKQAIDVVSLSYKPLDYPTFVLDQRRRELPPFVIKSGFMGGVQPAGGSTRCWLVPSPIAPGRCRVIPEVSACAASAAVAPPRMRLIRSRRRRASSKSNAAAAASILTCKLSIVSAMLSWTIKACLGF